MRFFGRESCIEGALRYLPDDEGIIVWAARYLAILHGRIRLGRRATYSTISWRISWGRALPVGRSGRMGLIWRRYQRRGPALLWTFPDFWRHGKKVAMEGRRDTFSRSGSVASRSILKGAPRYLAWFRRLSPRGKVSSKGRRATWGRCHPGDRPSGHEKSRRT